MANSMATRWDIEVERENDRKHAFYWPSTDTFCREIAFSYGVQPLRDFSAGIKFGNGNAVGSCGYDIRNGQRISKPFVEMHAFKTYRVKADVQLFNAPFVDFKKVAAFVAEHFPTVQIEQRDEFVGGLSSKQTYGFTLIGDEFVAPAFFWATALYRDGEIYQHGFESTLNYPAYYPKIMLFTALGPLDVAEYEFMSNHAAKLQAAIEYIEECEGICLEQST